MGSPVLLLHGIPVTSTIWQAVLDGLGGEGPLIAPDLLGFGSAPQPDIAYGPEDYFHWLEHDVLADVREPVTLIVHDFGGLVGLYWAVRRPERVKRLVIMNTTVYPTATPWSFLVQIPGVVSLIFRLMMTRTLFAWQMRALFGLKDDELIRQYTEVYTRPGDVRTISRVTRAWRPAEVSRISAGFAQLSCPVLLLWGLKDRYIFPWRPHGERFLHDFPGARVAHIEGAAHFLQAERPNEVLGHLMAFLKGS